MLGDTHSFVVRIWHEAQDKDGNVTTWRGSIEHVGHKGRFCFSDLKAMVHYVEECIGSACLFPPSQAGEEQDGTTGG
jgi:hypothetical protein